MPQISRIISLIPQIIRIALDLRGAAQSRHTRVQAAASALALTLAAAVVATLQAAGVVTLPYDLAVATVAVVAIIATPLLSRGIGANAIQQDNAESLILQGSEAHVDAAGSVAEPPDEARPIVAVAQDTGPWYALTMPLSIREAALLGRRGYDLHGTVYDLQAGIPTGKIRVPPSMRKRWEHMDK